MAYTLDARLEAWAATLPPTWSYRLVPLPPNNAMVATVYGGVRPYGGFYHKYTHDFVILNGWSNYRVSRIFVNQIILDCLRPRVLEGRTDPNLLERCRKARNIMHQLAIDICASVPHLFGILDEKTKQNDKDFGTIIGGYMLQQPLYTAGWVVGFGHPLCKFAIDCYVSIAHRMGIDHALSHIDALEEHQVGMAQWVDELDEEVNIDSSNV